MLLYSLIYVRQICTVKLTHSVCFSIFSHDWYSNVPFSVLLLSFLFKQFKYLLRIGSPRWGWKETFRFTSPRVEQIALVRYVFFDNQRFFFFFCKVVVCQEKKSQKKSEKFLINSCTEFFFVLRMTYLCFLCQICTDLQKVLGNKVINSESKRFENLEWFSLKKIESLHLLNFTSEYHN